MKLADAVIERSGLTLSEEAETCYEEIERAHPDILRHIDEAAEYIAEETGNLNPWTALQFRGTRRHSIWFRDPVTYELLLGLEGGWQRKAMDETIWLPLSFAFPSLTPCMLTGPVNDIYALHIEDLIYEELLGIQLKSLGIDKDDHCRIRKATEMWIVFSGPKGEMTCKTNHSLTGKGRPVEGVNVLGEGQLIPIPNTAEWRNPPEYATQLRTNGIFVEMKVVPDNLLKQFFNL